MASFKRKMILERQKGGIFLA